MKVYQVNIGGYDKEHPHNYTGEFYYVTEGEGLIDSRRAKCVPPFPVSGDLVLYIDGAFEIVEPIEDWAEEQIRDYDIVFNAHNVTADCYQEAEYCLSKGKGNAQIITQQLDDYRKEDIPRENNLAMGGIFLFRDTQKVRDFLKDWLDEFLKYPSRDQIALHKVRHLWEDKIKFGWFNPYTICKLNRNHHFRWYFKYHTHNELRPKFNIVVGWDTEKNIGKSLNRQIERIPDDEWVIVKDGDACFMIPYWGKLLEDAILRYPDTELFGCYTNRIGLNYQTIDGKISENYNSLDHYKIAEDLANKYWSECKIIDSTVGGFFMMFKKSTWNKNPFPEKLFDITGYNGRGALFDYTFCEYFIKNKLPIRLIKGLYMFHFYRMGKENPRNQIRHLL